MMRGEGWHKYVVPVPSLSLIRLLCSAQDEQYRTQLILSIIFPTGTHFRAKNFNVIWFGIVFGVFCEYFLCGTTTMACIVVVYLFNGMWYTDLAKASQYHAFWKFIYKNVVDILFSASTSGSTRNICYFIGDIIFSGGNEQHLCVDVRLCQTGFNSTKMEIWPETLWSVWITVP